MTDAAASVETEGARVPARLTPEAVEQARARLVRADKRIDAIYGLCHRSCRHQQPAIPPVCVAFPFFQAKKHRRCWHTPPSQTHTAQGTVVLSLQLCCLPV